MASPDEPRHPGGRPLKFKSLEELQKKIEAYFSSCWGPKIGMFGPVRDPKTKKLVIVQQKPYTVSGLAAFLDTSRETLMNYQVRDQFFDAIKASKDQIEAYAEEALYTSKNPSGAIFVMKNNYGWKDKTETDVTSGGKPIQGLAYLPERHGLETDPKASGSTTE